MAETLLDLGAEIEATDQLGVTPLIMAAQQANLPVLKLLLRRGANTGALSVDGLSALDIARKRKKAEVVEILQDAPGS